MEYFFSLFSLSKSATSSALNWSELALLVFGIVLVIGLVGEHKTPEEHRRRMKFFEMLVIIGVTGELFADGGIFLFSDQLQVISDNEIAEANTKAADAATSAKIAHEEAEAAKGAAGEAQQRAGAVAKQTEELNRNLQATKTQLATVDAKRAELEKSLINLAICNAPRVIHSWSIMDLPPNAKSYVDPLRPMFGQKVFIEVVPDAEARRAALNIFWTLIDAKWDVQGLPKLVDGLADGVSVQPWVLPAPKGGEIPNMSPYDHAMERAEKLVTFLHSFNWQAEQKWPRDAQGDVLHDEKVLPAGAIRIQVGLYPPTEYVSPPALKEFNSGMEGFKREREKQLVEQWANLPPEVRKKMEEADVGWEARTKTETSNSPCQPLNPPF